MNTELDERILGYLLSEKSLTLKVFDMVPTEYLQEEYREFYEIVKRCAKKYNETPTVRMVQNDSKWRDNFNELFSRSISYKNVDGFDPVDFSLDFEKLKERRNTHVLLEAARNIFQRNYIRQMLTPSVLFWPG